MPLPAAMRFGRVDFRTAAGSDALEEDDEEEAADEGALPPSPNVNEFKLLEDGALFRLCFVLPGVLRGAPALEEAFRATSLQTSRGSTPTGRLKCRTQLGRLRFSETRV